MSKDVVDSGVPMLPHQGNRRTVGVLERVGHDSSTVGAPDVGTRCVPTEVSLHWLCSHFDVSRSSSTTTSAASPQSVSALVRLAFRSSSASGSDDGLKPSMDRASLELVTSLRDSLSMISARSFIGTILNGLRR